MNDVHEPKHARTPMEQQLEAAHDRLDDVCGKLMMKFGSEAVANMLTALARKYCDIFGVQVRRLDLENQTPRGSA